MEEMGIDQVNGLSQSGDWLLGWQYRKLHVIEGAAGAGNNYQVRIQVHRSLGLDNGENVFVGTKCKSNFGDIRFVSGDESTELDYWLEDDTDGIFWVEVADSLTTTQNIYIYYGNPSATTTSDASSTFLFFDDFLGTSLSGDWNEWAPGGSYTVSSSVLTITGGSGAWEQIGTINQWSNNIAVHAYASWDESPYIQFGIDDRTATGNYQGSDRSEAGWRRDNAGKRYYVYHDGSSTTTSRISSISSYTNLALGWISGSSVRFWENDVLQETITSTVPDDNMGVCFSARETTTDVSIDWVFVRKFVTSEPSHGIWGYEATYGLSSLVASYSFEEGTGYEILDSTGNGNEGSINGPSWTEGVGSGALYFDGVNDYVTIPDSPSFETMTSEFTIEGLIKMTTRGTSRGSTLLMMDSDRSQPNVNTDNILVVVPSEIPVDDKVRVAIMRDTGYDVAYDFTHVLPLDEWMVFTIVLRTDDTMNLYVNGSFIQAFSGAPDLRTDVLETVYLGTDIDSETTRSDFFGGYIDELRIYNSSLSDSQIEQNYNDFFSEDTTTTEPTTTTETTTTSTTTTTSITTPVFTPLETDSLMLILGLSLGGIIALVVIVIVIMQVRSRPSFGGFDYG